MGTKYKGYKLDFNVNTGVALISSPSGKHLAGGKFKDEKGAAEFLRSAVNTEQRRRKSALIKPIKEEVREDMPVEDLTYLNDLLLSVELKEADSIRLAVIAVLKHLGASLTNEQNQLVRDSQIVKTPSVIVGKPKFVDLSEVSE